MMLNSNPFLCAARAIFLMTIGVGLAAKASAGTITGRVIAYGVKDARNTVVYIDKIEGRIFEPPTEPAKIDQINKEFIPHVLPLVKDGSVSFYNSDGILHNVHAYQGRASLFNLAMLPEGKSFTKTFKELGEIVLLCDVHPEMSAYILVLETPYAAVTNEEGQYVIDQVPQGQYTLKTWHEKLHPISVNLTIQGEESIEVNLELK